MRRLLFCILLLPLVGYSFEIDEVNTVKGQNGRVTEVRLLGSGFGSKDAPKLFDRVSHAYEKGSLNDSFSNYEHGQEITRARLSEGSGAIWKNVGREMYIHRGTPYKRYPESLAHYYGATGKSFVGGPRVWNTDGTPTTEPRMYLSWWFRQAHDTRWYMQHRLSGVSENFNPEPEETFTVDIGPHWSGLTEVSGKIISYDQETRILHATYIGQSNNNRLDGKVLTLDSSGATAALDERVQWRGANKFVRVWDSDGSPDSVRISWTNTTLGMSTHVNTNTAADVIEQKWNHMEMFVDTKAKRIITKVNGSVVDDVEFEADVATPGHSPTIGLIGFDASVDLKQEIWMDDIYLDSSFRRITLGNAPRHSDVTHEEVQYYTKWDENEIRFDAKLGGLNRRQPTYIYIYSEDGVRNEEGIPFLSPPVMPNS